MDSLSQFKSSHSIIWWWIPRRFFYSSSNRWVMVYILSKWWEWGSNHTKTWTWACTLNSNTEWECINTIRWRWDSIHHRWEWVSTHNLLFSFIQQQCKRHRAIQSQCSRTIKWVYLEWACSKVIQHQLRRHKHLNHHGRWQINSRQNRWLRLKHNHNLLLKKVRRNKNKLWIRPNKWIRLRQKLSISLLNFAAISSRLQIT